MNETKPRRPGRISRERVPVPESSGTEVAKSAASALRKKELADAERERWLARLRETSSKS
jgi:hypothetical protein